MQSTSENLSVGLGLRRDFIEEVAQGQAAGISFFEVAPENYIERGGIAGACFEKIADHYPILAHGLSLSIGSLDELNWSHLKKIKKFLRQYRIPWFSDHLCYSSVNAHQFHDLMPLPFTREAVKHVAARARIVQDFLEFPFALENVSFYLFPERPEMDEVDFVNEVLHQADVKVLFDINNVFVNAFNHGFSACDYLNRIDKNRILQIHIAGHKKHSEKLIIDTHGESICQSVWDLLQSLGNMMPLPPVLIERDNNIPELEILLGEVQTAHKIHEDSQNLWRKKTAIRHAGGLL